MAANEKILAVWGSPGSGKSTFSLKFAHALHEKLRATVIVLFCDITTPTLPVLFPNHKSSDLYSVGTVLSKTDIFGNDVVANMVTLKAQMNIGYLGYRSGENRFSFPTYTEEKASALLTVLADIADYVVVDCMTDPEDSILSAVSMRSAGTLFKLCTPDLACLSYYQSQNPIMLTGGSLPERVVPIMNIPRDDLAMLSGDAGAHLGRFAQVIPYSPTIREQYLEGRLSEATADRRYMQALKSVAEVIRR